MDDTADPTNPDHEWTGDGSVASTDDLAAAVQHVKNWMKVTMAGNANKVAALEAEVVALKERLAGKNG